MRTPANAVSIDEKLDIIPGTIYGMQHVLVMYAGAVTIPLIIGGALQLSTEEIALLINADLLCCGIISIVQALGIGRFIGIRLPVMMGVSFAGVAPMIAIGLSPELGLPGLYGAIIAAGFICMLLVPLFVRSLWVFPPVVTGTTLIALGVSLFGVAVTWAGGGYGAEDFGSPRNILVALAVLGTTLFVSKYVKGFLRNISILVGLIVGTVIAYAIGMIQVGSLAHIPWIQVVRPFQFGFPTFELSAILTMVLVVIITMVEAIGLLYSLSIILNKPLSRDHFTRGLRADALGATLGGIFNTFPYTTYSQNIGLIGITGIRSRYVCVYAGIILMALALFPRLAYFIALIPYPVLGGVALVMFGMVAASGGRLIQEVDFTNNIHNMFVFGISLGVGLIPTVSPNFFQFVPEFFTPLVKSGVLLTMLSAISLNLFFNGIPPKAVREGNIGLSSAT
ncbi:MAG TPA: nucleobase:cation symporter-2 family protein [Paenalcaligenes sp.]|nr:nucleobase:cation symporter-2 family protein [Paenalcaligenes sp.]